MEGTTIASATAAAERENKTIEAFIDELEAHWETIKPVITGMLFPDAAKAAKYRLAAWLRGSETLKDMTPPTQDGFGGVHKSPEWMVVCDLRNNPPSEQAHNRFHAMVQVRAFHKIVRRNLEA